MKKASVIFNRKSGRKKKYPVEYRIIDQLTRTGYDVEILYTESDGGKSLARRIAPKSDRIVAVGGDGTIGEVIGGIVESGAAPELSILPAGTVNDYARTLGISLNLEGAVKNLSKPQRIIEADVVKYNDVHAAYLIALGDFMESFTQVTSSRKNRYGTLAYLRAGLQALLTMKTYNVKIETGNEEITASSLLTIVANASSVGSFSKLLPKAKLDDHRLHILNVEASNPKEIIEIIALALRGRIAEHKRVRYIQARQVKINTDRLEVMDVDGDSYPFEPLDIELLPARIRLSIPVE
ncbi:diacylglycerol/lipid kinase family protein [Salinicoccus sp. HZC-1]|uniref:diacylglycerol/lipid kinase family protein n=1 Tax=Salinicoccus sp. HZC-1 TaxID=3385497 RepID=UPI00398AE359